MMEIYVLPTGLAPFFRCQDRKLPTGLAPFFRCQDRKPPPPPSVGSAVCALYMIRVRDEVMALEGNGRLEV